jgi:hypothetical protein
MIDELRGRIQAMNPEPNGDPSPDDLATVFALIEARRSSMTDADVREFRSPETPPSAWRRPVMAFAGMALLVLLLIGGTVLLVGGDDAPAPPATEAPPPTTQASPATTEGAAPTSSTSPAETTTTLPAADPVAGDLVSVEAVASGYQARIWDVAVGGPGLVAVGEVETPDDEYLDTGLPSRNAFVMVSPDGRTWERVDDLPATLGGDDWQQLDRVWGSPTGLIAEGTGSWFASTDGIAWTPVTDQDLSDAWDRHHQEGEAWFEFSAGGPGWVAALYRDKETGSHSCYFLYESRRCENPELQELLVSRDGLDWEFTTDSIDDLLGTRARIPTAPTPDEWNSGDSYYPWKLAWNEEHAVAVRYHADAMVGISLDGGETWLRVEPERFADERQLSYVSFGGETGIWTIDVVEFEGTYVIVGDAYYDAGVWILEWNDPKEEQ